MGNLQELMAHHWLRPSNHLDKNGKKRIPDLAILPLRRVISNYSKELLLPSLIVV